MMLRRRADRCPLSPAHRRSPHQKWFSQIGSTVDRGFITIVRAGQRDDGATSQANAWIVSIPARDVRGMPGAVI